jgi:pyruvate,water dikinase
MADLETYYNNRPFTAQGVARACESLFAEVEGLIISLAGVTGKIDGDLHAVLAEIRRGVGEYPAVESSMETGPLTLFLDAITPAYLDAVGAKAANLARVRRELALPTPDGFAVTTWAYRKFFNEGGLGGHVASSKTANVWNAGVLTFPSAAILGTVCAWRPPEEISELISTVDRSSTIRRNATWKALSGSGPKPTRSHCSKS